MRLQPVSESLFKPSNKIIKDSRNISRVNDFDSKNRKYLPSGPIHFSQISFGYLGEMPDSKVQPETELSLIQLLEDGYEAAKIQDNKITNRGNYILISGKDDLIALANTPNSWDKEFVLTQDIDMKNVSINGIGSAYDSFSGVFNGNGYKISNLKIDTPMRTNVGLFKVCTNAEIKNLTLEKVEIRGKNNVGGVVGTASETIIKNVFVKGNVSGESYLGGIAGNLTNSYISAGSFDGRVVPMGKVSIAKDSFGFSEEVYTPNHIIAIGGISGGADTSKFETVKASGYVKGENFVGGISGILTHSLINNSFCNAAVNGEKNTGSIAGKGQESLIKNSYLKTDNSYIGENENCNIVNCASGIMDYLRKSPNWDRRLWYTATAKQPRLHFDIENASPADIFLEDVKNDFEVGTIKTTNINYEPPQYIELQLEDMAPPKHYDKNNSVLEEIRTCPSPERLADIFAYWTNGFRKGFSKEGKEQDEILLALVRHPLFDLSKRYETGGIGEAIFCTPLYILSSLNKGYIFREALKRSDIDPFAQSGFLKEKDIFNTLCEWPIATNMFLLFDSKNPIIQNYVKEQLKRKGYKESKDELTNILCREPLGTVKCNEGGNKIYIPLSVLNFDKKMQAIHVNGNNKIETLSDIINTPDFPVNYQDSLGNTFAHILSVLPKAEQLTYLEIFAARGGNFDTKNQAGKTSLALAMDKKQHSLYTRLLQKRPNDIFYRDSEGNDALMLNVKYNTSRQQILNIERLHNLGLTLNTCDSGNSSLLIEAIKNNDIPTVNYLISHGIAVDVADENGQTALHHAFIQQNVLFIKWLLDSYAYPFIKDVLGMMPKDYWPDSNEELLKEGINLEALELSYKHSLGDKDGNTELTEAPVKIQDNSYDSSRPEALSPSKTFLEHIKDFGQNYRKIYYYTVQEAGKLSPDTIFAVSEYLVQNRNPFATEILDRFIRSGKLDINRRGYYGQTLLATALEAYGDAESTIEKINSMKFVKFFLDKDANTDIPDDNMQTSLHHCIFTGNLLLFAELLGKHPNVNATDLNGKNPLFYLGESASNPLRAVFEFYAQKRFITLAKNGTKFMK